MSWSCTKRAAAAAVFMMVALSGTGSSAFAQAEPQGYHYMFNKERIPLALDSTRIAVFNSAVAEAAPADRGGLNNSTVEALEEFGFNKATIKPHSWRGWTYADAPVGQRDHGTVENLVLQVAGAGIADFVSPVFIDEIGPRLVTRDILIGFHDDITQAEADQLVSDLGLGEIISREFSGMRSVYMVRSSSRNGFEVLEKANLAAERPEVKFAEPDMVFTTKSNLIPNDPSFGSLWGIRNTGQSGGVADMDMDGDEAWDITIGSASIITVVIDDGVQLNHPDLLANIAPSADFTGNSTGGNHIDTNSCEGHGTNVAGCVAAVINNSIGVVGIAPGTKVASAKFTVLNQPCNGTGSGSTSATVGAINYTITVGARVMNMSYSIGASGSIESAFQNTRNQGVVHFASTGNGGNNSIAYPASSPWVNAVGSVTRTGARSSFSQYGTGISVVAPGSAILTTNRNSTYVTTQGTSFSSPYAAGVAALVFSRNNLLNAAEVEDIVENTCMNLGPAGYDLEYGFGLVNARAALQATPPPGPPGSFNLSTPGNASTQVSRFPSFGWTTSLSASTYLLEVDNNSDFSSPEISTSSGFNNYTHTGTALNHSTTYFWRVTAENSLGSSNSTPASFSFTTISLPPANFNLMSPADGATNVSLTPTLSWATADRAETYVVQVDDNADFSSPIVNSNTALTIFSVFNQLVPGTTYYWRAFASNPLGQTISSPAARSFTTIATAPQPFNLQSPPDGSSITTLTPTMNWSDSPGAATYRILIDDDFAFASPEVDVSDLTESQYTVQAGTLLNESLYFWRVYAINVIGQTSSTPNVHLFATNAPTCCPGNADKSAPGSVTFADVTSVLSTFGNSYPNNNGLGDADCNGVVNFSDITSVLSNFGSVCP